ncbi:MAG TPA: hypothetical protein VEV41_24435 [Terriglobales bacterium]|nr:hypothetical protein [Terriglobales bacterium]
MSTARRDNMDLLAPPVAQTIQQRSLLIGVVFAVLAVIGIFISPPEQFMHSYLLGYVAWLGLTLGSMAILMLQYLTGGKWGLVIRRILEAGMKTLPLMMVLFIPLAVGVRHLYDWAKPEKVAADKHLQEITRDFLNPTGFVLRSIIYLVIWGGLIYLLSRWSAWQDDPPVRDFSPLYKRLSAPGLILYVFTISFGAIDWVMSLDARWISTIYPLIFVAGQVLLAFCFVVVVETILFRYSPMSQLLKPDELKDHGNMILTFIMLWAYFSFSQLLIIWAGNLPEEISWYVRRWVGGWQYLGIGLAVFHFAVPFVLLLSRERKRQVRRLVGVAILVIVMRFADLLWFIEPSNHRQLFVHWLDIAIPVAMGGFWLAYFFYNLKARPLLPVYDPQTGSLVESSHG